LGLRGQRGWCSGGSRNAGCEQRPYRRLCGSAAPARLGLRGQRGWCFGGSRNAGCEQRPYRRLCWSAASAGLGRSGQRVRRSYGSRNAEREQRPYTRLCRFAAPAGLGLRGQRGWWLWRGAACELYARTPHNVRAATRLRRRPGWMAGSRAGHDGQGGGADGPAGCDAWFCGGRGRRVFATIPHRPHTP